MITPPSNISQNILFFLNSTPLNEPSFTKLHSIGNGFLDANSAISLALKYCKYFFKMAEPYQPPIAVISIAGRAFWKNRKQQEDPKNKTRDLTKRRSVIKEYRNQNNLKYIEKIINITIKKQQQLEYEIQSIRHSQTQKIITTLQLVSLFFPHPGYNIWNSSMNIASRAISAQFYANNAACHPDNKMYMVLSLVSAIASVLTACKQTENIKEFDSVGHTIIALSFICMAIEAVYNFKNLCHSVKTSKNPQKSRGAIHEAVHSKRVARRNGKMPSKAAQLATSR